MKKPTETRKFLLFAGYEYYASGGMNDAVGYFETPEEAMAYKGWGDYDEPDENGEMFEDIEPWQWRQVVNVETMEIVAETEEQPYPHRGLRRSFREYRSLRRSSNDD